jgi:glycosyltransferase involved in cell wall biosynthesis
MELKMDENNMKLSIITINRNNAPGLEKTIQSVVTQTAVGFEYIVIDGASDDGSVDIIKKYADKITYWVSEPDTGIYNAMNKGICKAQGEYCLFLNSGDWLIEPETLKNVFTEIAGLQNAGVYYSDMRSSNAHYRILDARELIDHPINQQNSLIRRSLFLTHGFYNEKLKIASDWEFWLREYFIETVPFVHIKTNISVFDVNGIGSKDSPEKRTEEITIFKNVFHESAELVLRLRYINVKEVVISNIKNRQGIGMRFIIRCIIAWLSRKN